MSPTPPFPRPPASTTGPTLDPASLELALDTFQKRIDLLQQSLAQQNKLATLGMVTAVIAHEFNNILTPMISYTRFALTDKADEALRTKALTKALGGAERLANISKSLLGFARGDESNSAPVLPAVRETLACLARDLAKDGITLVLDVPEGLAVAMNAGHLQQVLMNLIVNARSAMLSGRAAGAGAGGGKRLTIHAGLKNAPDGGRKRVEISLADTGPGIPAAVLPRIFEPFFSTKRGPNQQEAAGNATGGAGGGDCIPRGGTGLGLTICQELVRVAGGTIRVSSEEGAGAVFVIELPAAT
jgi:signal transduction histidine kinase